MASLRNRGLGVGQAHVDEVLLRTSRQAVGAYCGLSGVCGVVPALGACYSVLVGGQCGKGPETRGAMELISRLAAVTAAEADPGCCKAFVRTALVATELYLEEKLGITATEPVPVTCSDSDRHPHGCRGLLCLYHPEAGEQTPPISATSQGGPMEPSQTGGTEHPSTASQAQGRYDEFFDLAYAEGALDRRTKILIALGAGLGAGCAPWTSYCLSVGRELGITEEEFDEAVQLAMTVGASKTLMLARAERSAPGFTAAPVVPGSEAGWGGTANDAGAASETAQAEGADDGGTGARAEAPAGSGWK